MSREGGGIFRSAAERGLLRQSQHPYTRAPRQGSYRRVSKPWADTVEPCQVESQRGRSNDLSKGFTRLKIEYNSEIDLIKLIELSQITFLIYCIKIGSIFCYIHENFWL